jgi:hypothetical protein
MENIDTWGNLRGGPYSVVEETHGDNFARISIYETDGFFRYGFQLKMGTIIKQKSANIGAPVYKTSFLAREAAVSEITALCATNKNSKRFLADFYKIRYSEYDLFGGVL